MTQPVSRRATGIVALLTLLAMIASAPGADADTILLSEDFESYAGGESLDGQGGWRASRGSREVTGVTVVAGSSTSGRGANAHVVRFHHDSGREPNPDMRRTFPAESNYVVESTFLLRLNTLDGDVGMHNVVLRGPGGAAGRFRFGPDGLILLGAAEEPGGSRKRGHTIIRRPIAGAWYRVTLAADPKTQLTWASATNLDYNAADQRGASPRIPFFSNVTALTRWAIERASMTPVDIAVDDVEVRAIHDPDRDPPLDLSSLDMPGEAEVSEGARVRLADGRLDDEQAVVVEAGSVAWSTPGMEGHHYAEFWFTPMAWNPVIGDEVVLASLRIGSDEFVLHKPADRSELRLQRNGQILQIYPTYAWDDNNWLDGGGGAGVRGLIRRTVPWHHVHLAVSSGRVSLTVDGFPARCVESAPVSGSISRLELRGEPGTAFAAMSVATGTPMEPPALRQRYVTLFLNEPSIMANLMTVPYLTRPPSIEGRVNEAEWSDAARITGFSKRGSGGALDDEIVGYIGFDDQRIYLALVSPTDGQGDQESMVLTLSPPFVSGEDPRRAVRLTGHLRGRKSEMQELPTRDEDYTAEWDWRVSRSDDGWTGEVAAAFEDLTFPIPNETDLWGFNLESPAVGATWSHIEAGPNLGNLRFQRGAPIIRPAALHLDGSAASMMLDVRGGEAAHELTIGMQYFGEADRLPRKVVDQRVSVAPGETQQVELKLDLAGERSGRVAVFVREGHLFVYYHSVTLKD